MGGLWVEESLLYYYLKQYTDYELGKYVVQISHQLIFSAELNPFLQLEESV